MKKSLAVLIAGANFILFCAWVLIPYLFAVVFGYMLMMNNSRQMMGVRGLGTEMLVEAILAVAHGCWAYVRIRNRTYIDHLFEFERKSAELAKLLHE